MIELKETFKGRGELRGFNFKQLCKSDTAYIYEVQHKSGGQCHYEVFKRKESKANTRTIGTKKITYPDMVLYPTSRAFGLWAWCYNSKDKALHKFNSLSVEVIAA